MRQTNQNLAAYVQGSAQLLELNIDPQYLPGVVDNFATIAAIATQVIEFNLPEKIEAAPVFKP